MTELIVENLNVVSEVILITPEQLKSQIPLSEVAKKTVFDSRQVIRNILDGKDHRILVVVGPCSIHDPIAAVDYAQRLKVLADEVADTLYIVMRVYFEKPRTTIGWKGLINDPHMNNTFEIQDGLQIGRELLNNIAEIGLPSATEALDPISPQYIQDCITWSAIGARTTESQIHREMASGLSSVVGFKNGTDGSLELALNALQSASNRHRFLGIGSQGQVTMIQTKGNAYAHLVLRGGTNGPNYDSKHISHSEAELVKNGVPLNIMVDCSHANSRKNPDRQTLVIDNVVKQIREGNNSIIGLMIESNINEGSQTISNNIHELKYGVSVTDACINWEVTENLVRSMRDKLKETLPKRNRTNYQ